MRWYNKLLLIGSLAYFSACVNKPAPWVPNVDLTNDVRIEESLSKDSVVNLDGESYYGKDLIDSFNEVIPNDVFGQNELLDQKNIFDLELEELIEIKDSNMVDEISQSILEPYEPDENCVALFHFEPPNYLKPDCTEKEAVEYGLTTKVNSENGLGDARYFDGNAAIVLSDFPELNPDEITIDVLIKPKSTESSFKGDRGWIINKAACPLGEYGECKGYGLFIKKPSKLVGVLGIAQNKVLLEADYLFPADKFTHLRLSYEQGIAKLFINGECLDSFEIAGPITKTENMGLGIGSEPYTQIPAHCFIGAIDEVRISNVAKKF
ncbi:hypothetical protein HON71_05845 [Candidatus Woesearchaeota archaeon]|jgi:hypothetical protein|nr:hypothetical protein [Candidatus Woesearchaeota archaeon]